MSRKLSLYNRILSAVLALVLLLGSVPVVASAQNPVEEEEPPVVEQETPVTAPAEELELFVSVDGHRVESVRFARNEKVTLLADGLVEGATYQWQIKMPGEDLWVDMFEHTDPSLTLSYPMLRNMMDENHQAQVRCLASINGLVMFQTIDLPVTVDTDAFVMPEPEQETEALRQESEELYAAMPLASTDIVTIRIEYHYRDRYGNVSDQVWEPYVANIQSGTNFSAKVPNRTVPGRKVVFITDPADPLANPAGATLVEEPGGTSYVDINLTNVTENITFTVYYDEDKVPYYARYFLQNVNNDLYTEDVGQFAAFSGYPGDEPEDSEINKPITGFTSLFYQPDEIAADGSTVFEVYYDRNYYLINFNLDGGFGTAPVYARYETVFTVAQPEKPGYVFQGWDLIQYTDSEGNKISTGGDTNGNGEISGDELDDLPNKIPAQNQTYKAIWGKVDTTYTIAYWILDANGNKTFIGSRSAYEKSGEYVNGKHDLDQGYAICGVEEHTHSNACIYDCGIEPHTHMQDACFDGMDVEVNIPGYDGEQVIAAVESDGKPKAGYIYVIITEAGKLWPKLYLEDNNGNGAYYTINGVGAGDTAATEEQVKSIIEGEALGEGTYGTLTARKYKPKTKCGEEPHTHTNACRPCYEHTHDENCYQDPKYLVEVDSEEFTRDGQTFTVETDKNVLVKGDGSTVVNVYYKYKEYTLKFYYAASKESNGSTIYTVVGGSAYFFGGQHGITNYSTYNNSSTIDMLNRMFTQTGQLGITTVAPELNEKGRQLVENGTYQQGEDTDTTSGRTYYYISFKARYNDDISQKWPIDILAPVTMADGHSNKVNTGLDYAVASAWNGEHHVWYSKNNGNETIKGVYAKLDYKILYDSSFADSSTVSYLCFWENGANVGWSVPELYRYNIWVEISSRELQKDSDGNIIYDAGNPIHIDGETPVRKVDGIFFKRSDVYNTCDDSDLNGQTQPSLTGYSSYKRVGEKLTRVSEVSDVEKEYDGDIYTDGMNVHFYYRSNTHYLKFFNHNRYLQDGRGSEVAYGTPLSTREKYVDGKKTDENDVDYLTYPLNLEKDAYTFEGWYTSPQFLAGTEVDWETMTMPDADVTLYANWEPVTYTVTFSTTFDHMNNDQFDHGSHQVDHGETIKGTIDIPKYDPDGDGTPDPRYRFVGWFYMEDGEKIAFDPSEMTVNKNIELFAEWATSITTQYTISYEKEDGTPLSKDTDGYIFVGTTKTFTAKPKDQLELLSDADKDFLWLPHTNSHSILMKELAENNTFTFRYVHKDKAPYTVLYLNSETGENVLDPKYEGNNTDAVVTERFVYVPGYTTPPFNQTLVLSANEAENVIIFYYTKNPVGEKEKVAYLVTHYIQDLNPDGTLSDHYSEYTSHSDLKELGAPVKEKEMEILGFTFNAKKSVASGTVVADGLELKLYYDRNTYPYVIKYIDRTTGNKVKDPVLVEDIPYQRNVSATAPEIKGYNLYSSGTQTLKIGIETGTTADNITRNVITFYYEPKQITINYVPICTEPVAVTYGYVSQSIEIKSSLDNIAGSQAMEVAGFRFVGWYKDEAHTEKVSDAWVDANKHLRPVVTQQDLENDRYDYTYYALFEPVKKDLTITKKAVDGTTIPETDSFLFRITGTNAINQEVSLLVTIHGAGSVTIQDLYCGNYTVTEITDWSWTYDVTQGERTVVLSESGDKVNGVNVTSGIATAVFTNSAKKIPWLHGENFAENNFD